MGGKRRLPQLRWPPGHQAFDPRLGAHWHQSGELFAAGWSACFESAVGLAARKMKIILPADPAIDAEVDLNLADGGYFLRARLNVSLPGVEPEFARALVDEAHQICPYSKATRGNIDVAINLV